jgi:toxin ParE1/3/4
MPYAIQFIDEAKAEIDQAYQWYEAKQTGLGDEFIEVVDEVLKRIAHHPLIFPQQQQMRRKAVLPRFPYNLYFEVHEPDVVVIAVFHTARNPEQWQKR